MGANNYPTDYLLMDGFGEQVLGKRQGPFNDKFMILNHDQEDLSFERRPSFYTSQSYHNFATENEFDFDDEQDWKLQPLKFKSGLKDDSETMNKDEFHQASQNENKVNFEEDRSLIEKKAIEIDKKKAKRAAKANELKMPYLKRVLKFRYGLEDSQGIDEDIRKTYDDDLARKCILLLYGKNRDEDMTKEDFANLLKTQEFVNNRRKDEMQNKVYSKITWHVYSKKFKTSSSITKKEAKTQIKVYYDLDLKDQIFERMWGKDRKEGMHMDVVIQLLTNEKLIQDFLSKEVLEEILEEMHRQTFEDIKNILDETSDQGPEEFLAYLTRTDQIVIEGEGKRTRRGGKQGVKLPWTCQDNIKAVIEYLEKLLRGAESEQQAEMLQDSIDHFSQKRIRN